jgi:3-oxoacyl-[acyl-carrier protein] reductase
MDLGLKDKRALVLASTKGLGRGIAEALAAEGVAVAVCGRDKAAAGKAAAEIAAAHEVRAEGYALDLTEASSVTALGKSVMADFSGIDIVVHNSGGPPPGPITEVEPARWMAQFEAMFLGYCRITAVVLPGMRARKWGRILISSSSGAVQPLANLGISNTMRAGLLGWAKTLSNEVAADGVTVNTILPGRIHTARVDTLDTAAAERLGVTLDDARRASMATIPVGRYGSVAEYGAVAAFLASRQASYVTGAVMRVDGGLIRAI